MNLAELLSTKTKGRTIQHEKGGVYVILGFGEMKFDGEWHDSCTYMDVKTKKSYTRKVTDFKKFTMREKK